MLIDGDPQGHASLTFGVDSDELETTLGAYLISGWTAKQASDYIIFDMAPAVDILLENIVEIVDDLVVVATPETYAVKNAETTQKQH